MAPRLGQELPIPRERVACSRPLRIARISLRSDRLRPRSRNVRARANRCSPRQLGLAETLGQSFERLLGVRGLDADGGARPRCADRSPGRWRPRPCPSALRATVMSSPRRSPNRLLAVDRECQQIFRRLGNQLRSRESAQPEKVPSLEQVQPFSRGRRIGGECGGKLRPGTVLLPRQEVGFSPGPANVGLESQGKERLSLEVSQGSIPPRPPPDPTGPGSSTAGPTRADRGNPPGRGRPAEPRSNRGAGCASAPPSDPEVVVRSASAPSAEPRGSAQAGITIVRRQARQMPEVQ